MMGSQHPLTQQLGTQLTQHPGGFSQMPGGTQPDEFVGDDGAGSSAYSFLDYATQASEFDDHYLQFTELSQGPSQQAGWHDPLVPVQPSAVVGCSPSHPPCSVSLRLLPLAGILNKLSPSTLSLKLGIASLIPFLGFAFVKVQEVAASAMASAISSITAGVAEVRCRPLKPLCRAFLRNLASLGQRLTAPWPLSSASWNSRSPLTMPSQRPAYQRSFRSMPARKPPTFWKPSCRRPLSPISIFPIASPGFDALFTLTAEKFQFESCHGSTWGQVPQLCQ